MKWVLNSAVLAAGAYGRYEYRPASQEEAATFLQAGPVESRVGYAETAAYLRELSGVDLPLSREGSPLAPGDVALVCRLRYRVDPTRKGAIAATSPEDWELAFLERLR